MSLCGVDLHPLVLLLVGQRRLHCHIAIDYPHVRWWSRAIPNANPQVTEEAGPPVAAVSFARPLVSSKFLQLAQAVGEQNVRQLLVSEARHVLRFAQLHL